MSCIEYIDRSKNVCCLFTRLEAAKVWVKILPLLHIFGSLLVEDQLAQTLIDVAITPLSSKLLNLGGGLRVYTTKAPFIIHH